MTIVYANDWEGLYDNEGFLITQGHSIRIEEVLEKLGYYVDHKNVCEDQKDLDSFGNSLPEKLKELRRYLK